MQRYHVLINEAGGKEAASSLDLDAPSLPMALIVADINMAGGTAEIWRDKQRLARLRKRHGSRQAYWEVG